MGLKTIQSTSLYPSFLFKMMQSTSLYPSFLLKTIQSTPFYQGVFARTIRFCLRFTFVCDSERESHLVSAPTTDETKIECVREDQKGKKEKKTSKRGNKRKE